MSIQTSTKDEYSKIHDTPKTYVRFNKFKTQFEVSRTPIHLLILNTNTDDKIGLYKNGFVNVCSAWSRDGEETIEHERMEPTSITFDPATTTLQTVLVDTTLTSITLTEPLLEKFCVLRAMIIGDYIPNRNLQRRTVESEMQLSEQ